MLCVEITDKAGDSSAHRLAIAQKIPCGLAAGCTLAAWHKGTCVIALSNGKRERKQKAAEVEPEEPLPKKAAPSKSKQQKSSDKGAKPAKKPTRKRKKPKEVPKVEEEAPAPKRPAGSRGGTRSRGQPSWDPDELLAGAQEGGAGASSSASPVTAALSVGEGGSVALQLTVSVKPRKPPSNNKSLAALRDYLGCGRTDPFSNDAFTSVSSELVEVARSGNKVQWGCICRGKIFKGGEELQCRRCKLTFHEKCERLDYTQAELKLMKENGTYICADCERQERADEGFDPALGRFIWTCRHCTRTFEEEDQQAAKKHGARCAREVSRRQWSCSCDGKMGKGNTKMLATQCVSCSFWFHFGCKNQKRNWWDEKPSKEMCASCEKLNKKGKNGSSSSSGGVAAATAAGGVGAASGAASSSVPDQPESERPGSSASRGGKASSNVEGLTGLANATAMVQHDEIGTLADGRVYVKVSTLGEHSGLGLFAGVPIRRNDVVSSYYGVPLYREQLAPDHDTSYVVRVPNSGGTLINGKPYADAIRANPSNPTEEGKYFPVEGANEWDCGAGAMANDPRDRKLNNAMLVFVKPKGSKALRELALVRPTLVATRDIEAGEEVFYSYGSEKPFEHIRKQLQAQKDEEEKRKGIETAVKLVWMPHDRQ